MTSTRRDRFGMHQVSLGRFGWMKAKKLVSRFPKVKPLLVLSRLFLPLCSLYSCERVPWNCGAASQGAHVVCSEFLRQK